MEKPKITRLVKLRNRRGLVLGMDFQDIFEEGMVYSVTEMMGVIMFNPIGEMLLPKDGSTGEVPNDNSSLSTILNGGKHLLTEKDL